MKGEDSYSASGKVEKKHSSRLSLAAFHIYPHIRMKTMSHLLREEANAEARNAKQRLNEIISSYLRETSVIIFSK